jgi:hypothetical protein
MITMSFMSKEMKYQSNILYWNECFVKLLQCRSSQMISLRPCWRQESFGVYDGIIKRGEKRRGGKRERKRGKRKKRERVEECQESQSCRKSLQKRPALGPKGVPSAFLGAQQH